jgi:hypothetical protein
MSPREVEPIAHPMTFVTVMTLKSNKRERCLLCPAHQFKKGERVVSIPLKFVDDKMVYLWLHAACFAEAGAQVAAIINDDRRSLREQFEALVG